MSNFIEAGKVSEFEDGTIKKVQAQGQEILLARIKDEFYAVSNRCPHLGGDLSEGKLAGTIITCPRHGSQFDLKDGKVVRWLKGTGLFSSVGKALKPPKPLNKYNVNTEGDVVRIEI
jgi:3-phenylpropionate/trans-cinnamate dioxygenase ferredoxin subunit